MPLVVPLKHCPYHFIIATANNFSMKVFHYFVHRDIGLFIYFQKELVCQQPQHNNNNNDTNNKNFITTTLCTTSVTTDFVFEVFHYVVHRERGFLKLLEKRTCLPTTKTTTTIRTTTTLFVPLYVALNNFSYHFITAVANNFSLDVSVFIMNAIV